MTHRGAPVVRLDDLTWPEAVDWFRNDPRLMVAVGCFVQHGPHLPLGTDTVIAGGVAEGIAARHGVLMGPTLPFGAVSDRDAAYAGTSPIGAKTLHRLLNELVAAWERHGVRDVVLLTSTGYSQHYSALVGVLNTGVSLRAVDLNVIDLTPVLGRDVRPERAAEVETSLMMFLAPERVRSDVAVDEIVSGETLEDLLDGSEPLPLPGSAGVVGRSTDASAEKGQKIYDYFVSYVGDRLYGEQPRSPATFQEESGGEDENRY